MPDDEQRFGEPEFLGWYLLRRLKDQSDDQISRSKFLKLCCLADRRLLEAHDYDVGLARYWYMYGELANEHEFTGRFYNAPRAWGWDGQQYIPKDLRLEDFEVSQEALELVPRAVRWTVSEFGRSNVEEIKRHQYEQNADNEFIREYSQLRWLLGTIDLGSQQRLTRYGEGMSNEEYLREGLDVMMEQYPGNEPRYGEMKSLYRRWDDTTRLMLDQSVEYSRIAEFLDDFIRTLSKVVLRFNYQRNISEERIAEWEEDAVAEKSQFATRVRELRSELLSQRSRSTELDGVASAYSQDIEARIDEALSKE